MPSPILMIDARNCMYRACYASQAEHERKKVAGLPSAQKHPLLIMLRLIVGYINNYRPGQVQIFWDAPRATVWRRTILPTYKDRENNQHVVNLAADLGRTQEAAMSFFDHVGAIQFYRDKMEADDLIFAACKVQCHLPIVIVSSDGDMLQIPYLYSNVRIYNHDKGGEVPTPKYNFVFQKALMGDKSDNIPGYDGIGPKKSEAMLADLRSLEAYLSRDDLKSCGEPAGRKLFQRNLLLMDLACCPYLLHNQSYILRKLSEPVGFSRDEVRNVEQIHKVKGLIAEYTQIVGPFRQVGNYEEATAVGA